MLKSITPNDHDLLIPDTKCTRLPQLQVWPSVRRWSRFHQRSCTLLGPGHLLGRSSDANSRPVVLQQAQNAMEAWCSLLTLAFFVPVLPMHCVSGWPRPKTAGTKVAWHDVAVSRTQTFKQNIFAGHLFSSLELLSKRLEKQQYDGCLSGQRCRHRSFTVILCNVRPAHSSVACCPMHYRLRRVLGLFFKPKNVLK